MSWRGVRRRHQIGTIDGEAARKTAPRSHFSRVWFESPSRHEASGQPDQSEKPALMREFLLLSVRSMWSRPSRFGASRDKFVITVTMRIAPNDASFRTSREPGALRLAWTVAADSRTVQNSSSIIRTGG